MKRRAYLAAVTATALAGCTGSDVTDRVELPDNASVDFGNGDDEPEEPVEGPSDGETFDDFGDLSQWSAAVGTLYRVVDEEPYVGSQSALVEAGEDDDQGRIVRDLSPPVDLSGTSPGLAFATDGAADPLIQLFTASGGRIDFRCQSSENRSLVRSHFGVDAVHGEPDLGAVTQIQIGQFSPEDETTQLWIDDLYFVSRPRPGRVLLQFAGGYESHYEEAAPLLAEYGYPGTTFVATERVREEEDHEGDRVTEDQLEELGDAGWTIGSYSTRGLDLTGIRDRDPVSEIADAREWLEDRGFSRGARFFAYPLGAYDDRILSAVDDHHDLGFAGRYPAQGSVANPLLCSSIPNPDADQARRALDLTADLGGITALSYLDVGGSTREDLGEALAHLDGLTSAGDLEVVSPAEIQESFLV